MLSSLNKISFLMFSFSPSSVHFSIIFEQKFYLLTVYKYFCPVLYISKLFENYVKFNFHVGLAVFAFAKITALDFDLYLNFLDQVIFFVAPFLAYNFIKFYLFFLDGITLKVNAIRFLLGFTVFSVFLFQGGVFYLSLFSRTILFLTILLVLLYCFPLPGFKLNFRGFKGLKIHLVALSWVLITVFLPLSMAEKNMTEFSLIYGLQRYLFVLVATLPFEIRDLKLDDPNLSTWPQKWGIKKTRLIGGLLLSLFVFLEIYYSASSNILLVLSTAFLLMAFVLKAKVEQSKYFSSFWVEGIPILWLILKYLTI
tara:strand:+ start:1053 stop:1985 length:933 start_codon:yes stop_codon:yes gene_type:complete